MEAVSNRTVLNREYRAALADYRAVRRDRLATAQAEITRDIANLDDCEARLRLLISGLRRESSSAQAKKLSARMTLHRSVAKRPGFRVRLESISATSGRRQLHGDIDGRSDEDLEAFLDLSSGLPPTRRAAARRVLLKLKRLNAEYQQQLAAIGAALQMICPLPSSLARTSDGQEMLARVRYTALTRLEATLTEVAIEELFVEGQLEAAMTAFNKINAVKRRYGSLRCVWTLPKTKRFSFRAYRPVKKVVTFKGSASLTVAEFKVYRGKKSSWVDDKLTDDVFRRTRNMPFKDEYLLKEARFDELLPRWEALNDQICALLEYSTVRRSL